MNDDRGWRTDDRGEWIERCETLVYANNNVPSVFGPPSSVLVIGYGNPLRGDDAVGYQIAQEMGNWELAHVAALAVHQLTPELAATLADYDTAIFVDAAQDQNLSFRPIEPKVVERTSTHTCDPQGLLALADALYEHCPRAWWLTIPTTQYTLGTPLSVVAQAGMEDALQIMRVLFENV